jgi:hypothetical protein
MLTVKEWADSYSVTLRTSEHNDAECFGVSEDDDGVRFYLNKEGTWYVKGDKERLHPMAGETV